MPHIVNSELYYTLSIKKPPEDKDKIFIAEGSQNKKGE